MIATTPKFVNTKLNSFHQELKKRVNDYFENNQKLTTGNFSLHFKAVLLWSLYLLAYVHLLFFTPSTFWCVVECVAMGILTAGIGFNVMHDGGHESFSKHKIINKIAAYSVNLLGASAIMWRNKHNIVHHTYTNIDGIDDDIDARPYLRMSPTQKKYWVHKYQHFYVWFLYSLLLLFWVFATDYVKYFKQKVGVVALKKMNIQEHVTFWIAKATYYFLMIGLPIYLLNFTTWLVGFLIITMVAGVVLSIVFQLAHTVEEAAFPMPTGDTNKIENEWAIHQVQTTANFATKNKVINWFTGGLNFQIEHHLFPKISHVHYPAISKIIKQTCTDFGLQYIEFKKTRQAIYSHIKHLRHMGVA
jgi:linoleoyl-CoA desaturase